MTLTFRAKLMLIVGTAALALVLVVAVSSWSRVRQMRDLGDVEGRLVPKLELGLRLESDFDHLRQSMLDAVAAQDSAALEATATAKNQLVEQINGARGALNPHDAAALAGAIQAYYDTASNISRRLIQGETGEALVDDMAEMQARHGRAVAMIKQTTRLEGSELTDGFAAIRNASQRSNELRLGIGLVGLGLLLALSVWVSRGVLRPVSELSKGFSRFGRGEFDHTIPVLAEDELGTVAKEANQMAASLKRLGALRDQGDWLKAGQVGLSDELRGELDLAMVAKRALTFLARRIDARAGALYVAAGDGTLQLLGSYALGKRASDVKTFAVGEGLVGQAAASAEISTVEDLPSGYLKIRSGVGDADPKMLVFVPLALEGQTIGVIEFAFLKPCSDRALELLRSVRETLISAIVVARSRAALSDLLERTRQQAERLATQEEELRVSNRELLARQVELQNANEELDAQGRTLSDRNTELEGARERLQLKAEELTKVSSYKSQFLANMSHELRTPLNSMLLLSHLLTENEAGNLTAKQVEHCKTINSAGQDLLRLINEILDLAKIEAGRQEVDFELIEIQRFTNHARRVFEPLAAEKGLKLVISVHADVPPAITTDPQRLERILTNLLANAIKFTDRGEVTLRIRRPAPDTQFSRADLTPDSCLGFSVEDTGIGIDAEAHDRVFTPFEQLESRTNRRYAGTGLGLAIARESAGLLGGELQLRSAVGKGSTFTCYLPLVQRAGMGHTLAPKRSEQPRTIRDDRAVVVAGDSHLLVVEDDPVFAEQLVEVIHARKFKVIVAATGQDGLAFARERRPKGIVLDVKLPDIDGWTVLEQLRRDAATRTIPVHFVSAIDAPEHGLSLGAIGYLTKPATRTDLARVVRVLTPPVAGASQSVLVVEDDAREGGTILQLLADEGIDARHVKSAGAALECLENGRFGCMILDLGLPDMDGLGLLETVRARPTLAMPRVVVHTGRSLSRAETRELEAYAECVVTKDANSGTRLLEEVRLLIRHIDGAPAAEQPASVASAVTDFSLQGFKILLAEDDMRTIYSLSALLQSKGADVVVAETGREALDLLERHTDVRGVLMDIMMPEMDGYDAIIHLRKNPRLAALPVIALTAKAMRGEKERCLAAGATEYLTKPVDSTQLLKTLESLLKSAVHSSKNIGSR